MHIQKSNIRLLRTAGGKIAIVSLFLFMPFVLYSQQKAKVSINEDWLFTKSNERIAENVSWEDDDAKQICLPHTWNDKDVLDEIPGYYRGGGWYKKTLSLEKGWEEKRIFLEFEAANQHAEVFINGKAIGIHVGGYSAFRFDITERLISGQNNFELCVRVDNSFDEDIPPLTADFTFFGGIYRDAWLIYAPKLHFSLDHYGGPGVFWQTPGVNKKEAKVKIFGYVSNYTSSGAKYKLQHILIDEQGNKIKSKAFKQSFEKGVNLALKPVSFKVKAPDLWSPESPTSYTLHSRILDAKTGELIDEETNPIGFRWFEFSAKKGFFLNDEHLKLRGISRHQDYPGKGNSIGTEEHKEDVLSIKNMGANFLRIAHYPQDQDVINTCDTIGLITSVEIPIVNRITESSQFTDNCMLMMEEMIWQNYNHPGLIMWTYMNEVLLRPPFLDDPDRLAVYYSNVTSLAEKLENKVRALDPYRVTMIPNHGSMSKYVNAELTRIPMVVGWNLYNGWYGSGFGGFEKYLEKHHEILSDKPLIVSEYGAGHDPRLISSDPKRFDFTSEYALNFNKHYNEAIEERDYVAGGIIWILNDFSSEERGDAVPRINSKGICSVDRQPKESYWYFKSSWCKEPFVKIWTPYPGIHIPTENCEGENKKEISKIRIYTNSDSLKLILNGIDIGIFQSHMGLVEANIPLLSGINDLKARIPNTEVEDNLSFNFLNKLCDIDKNAEKIELRISCGDHRYFWDDVKSELWLPDQAYKKNNWGYLGGKAFTAKTRHGVKPSADQEIQNTPIDPVYQTQRIAPSAYQFDVPSGRYEVALLFAELDSPGANNLAYNLGDDRIIQNIQERVFSVALNGDEVIDSFNLLEEHGPSMAIEKKFELEVTDNGLQIEFIKNTGDPVIAGIVIRSLDEKNMAENIE